MYAEGGNIIQYLKSLSDSKHTEIEHILISYDFQAGIYIQYVEKNKTYINNYTDALAKVIGKFDNCNLIMEVGVGEATTFVNLLPKLASAYGEILGFDISWSRLKYALEYAKKKQL